MARIPINLSDRRVNAPRAAANTTEGAPASEAEKQRAAGQVSSPSVLLSWVLARDADRSTRFSIEHEQQTTSDDYLTVTEAASILRVSERTLRRRLVDGQIQHLRVGRQIRIARGSIGVGVGERWIVKQ